MVCLLPGAHVGASGVGVGHGPGIGGPELGEVVGMGVCRWWCCFHRVVCLGRRRQRAIWGGLCRCDRRCGAVPAGGRLGLDVAWTCAGVGGRGECSLVLVRWFLFVFPLGHHPRSRVGTTPIAGRELGVTLGTHRFTRHITDWVTIARRRRRARTHISLGGRGDIFLILLKTSFS